MHRLMDGRCDAGTVSAVVRVRIGAVVLEIGKATNVLEQIVQGIAGGLGQQIVVAWRPTVTDGIGGGVIVVVAMMMAVVAVDQGRWIAVGVEERCAVGAHGAGGQIDGVLELWRIFVETERRIGSEDAVALLEEFIGGDGG